MNKNLNQEQTKKLLEIARLVRKKSYAPYSKFYVGAAILTKDGQIFSGCNVENAAYGEAICAERVALTKAVSEGQKQFVAIALATSVKKTVWPCGACRQILAEFSPDITVLASGLDGKTQTYTLGELLPFSFGPKDLELAK